MSKFLLTSSLDIGAGRPGEKLSRSGYLDFMRWAIWIFCLSLLSVGVKNSEEGLAGDAPLYASLSERILETGDWAHLDARLPDFKPYYADHPHLSFWLQAAIFKVFGAADWSARILGHLYYFCFMLLFFLTLRAMVSERAAVVGTLLLWIQPHFNAAFSSFLLDPAALFWGVLFLVVFSQALKSNSGWYSGFAGICLGLCALSKGLTFLGFGPPALLILALHLFARQKATAVTAWNERIWQAFRHSVHALGALCLVIGLYAYALSRSSVPEFLEFYWWNQVMRRFSNLWSFKDLFLKEFWWPMLKDSLGFLVLCPLAFLNRRHKAKSLGVPLVMFFSFVAMYAPNHRFGGHYMLMFLPTIAWLSAMALERFVKQHDLLVVFSQSLAVVAFAIVQYTGITLHGSAPTLPLKVLKETVQSSPHTETLTTYLDAYPDKSHFISASRLVWYAKTSVIYPSNPPPPPSKHRALYLYSPSTGELSEVHRDSIERSGWCPYFEQTNSILFKACQKSTRPRKRL